MAEHQNFKNGDETFNIYLEENGDLHFKANGQDGDGDTRMVIADTSGTVTIGGPNQSGVSGEFGQLQLKSPTNENTVFLGATETESSAVLGGSGGRSGRIQLFDSGGNRTVNLDGDARRLEFFDGREIKRTDLRGDLGLLQLLNFQGVVTVDLSGERGELTLGGEGATYGELTLQDINGNRTITLAGRELRMWDSDGNSVITCDGDTTRLEMSDGDGNKRVELLGTTGTLTLFNIEGHHNIVCESSGGRITCGSLTETSDGRLKTNIAPLTNALDSILALRGIRYQRKQVTAPTAAAASDAQQIGFVGQEVEVVCPELVATDAEGYKSVSYSRITAVLVEAVKEQQQLIREQAAALEAISERLEQLSVADQGEGDLK